MAKTRRARGGSVRRRRTGKRLSTELRFGQRLHAWRTMRQLPLKHVAHDLKVSVSVISQWERGHRFPSLRNLESIAEYLGVPTCYLICANDDACPYKQDW